MILESATLVPKLPLHNLRDIEDVGKSNLTLFDPNEQECDKLCSSFLKIDRSKLKIAKSTIDQQFKDGALKKFVEEDSKNLSEEFKKNISNNDPEAFIKTIRCLKLVSSACFFDYI